MPLLLSLVLVVAGVPVYAAEDAARRPPASLASLAPPAAAGPLRILLVDDDHSDNNHYPGDKRLSQSDRIFRQLVSDAVGGDAVAWAVETVKPYASGPGVERLRKYSLVLWYTGANYGGNPDNSAVLSIEDEKTVRRYLEEVGGAVVLVSPGYVSKVLGADGTWEKSTWPFLSEVLGVRGGHGLAQRFEPGTVNASGAQFTVGKGSAAVESQFSTVNPDGAAVVFTAAVGAGKKTGKPSPVATAFPYGRGRMVYVGFTFENLAEPDLAPAFRHLITATGLVSPNLSANVRPAARPKAPPASAVSSPEAEPATVQVSGTPVSAVVSWTLQSAIVQNARLGGSQHVAGSVAKPSATSYTPTVKVERLVPNAAPVRLTMASPDAFKADDPGPLTPGRAVTYRVTLTDTQGRTGIKEASFTPPPARDPEGLSASVQADGSVVLTWPEVQGVSSYQISGSALSAPITVRNATQWHNATQTPGPQHWKVASVYERSGVLTPASAWPSVATRILPRPGQLFLTQPNGPGSTATTEAYSRTFCPDPFAELSACSAAQFIRDATNWEQVWEHDRRSDYRAPRMPRQWATATFADPLDLGVGRRVNCAPRKNGVTVCWATSHFSIPSGSGLSGGSLWPTAPAPESATASGGAPAAAPNFLAFSAQAGEFREAKSLNIIVMSDTKAFFGSWKLDGQLVHYAYQGAAATHPEDTLDAEHMYATKARLDAAAALDSQGRKGVPHACLSCHGGTYNPVTKQVTGSSLLPLVPARLVFTLPSRAGAEESMRRINEIVLQSNPAPAIVDQVQALYGGTPGTPGATANEAAVPAGWTQQAGLYRQVIAPYCASCHFAQRGPMNFRNWGNLLQNKDAVQRTVCREFTMPHSEILFRKFWTEGGAVSLPGLLSSALGFPKCPQ